MFNQDDLSGRKRSGTPPDTHPVDDVLTREDYGDLLVAIDWALNAMRSYKGDLMTSIEQEYRLTRLRDKMMLLTYGDPLAHDPMRGKGHRLR